jgi:hypothetical protein
LRLSRFEGNADDVLRNASLGNKILSDGWDRRERFIKQGILCQVNGPDPEDTVITGEANRVISNTNRLLFNAEATTESDSVGVLSSYR